MLSIVYILLNKFRGISLYVANDVIAKLYGTKSLVKEREMVDNSVTYQYSRAICVMQ